MSTSFRELLDFLSAVLKLREPLNFLPVQDLEEKPKATNHNITNKMWLIFTLLAESGLGFEWLELVVKHTLMWVRVCSKVLILR
jgi:hypothetical protein